MSDVVSTGVNFAPVVVPPLLVFSEMAFTPMMPQDFLGAFAVNGHVHLAQLTIKLVHVVLRVKWTRNKIPSPFHVLEVALLQHFARSFHAVTLQFLKCFIQSPFGL